MQSFACVQADPSGSVAEQMLVESQNSPSRQLFWKKTWVQISPLPALGRHVPSAVELAPEQNPVVHSTAL